jgi:hypothetical protein
MSTFACSSGTCSNEVVAVQQETCSNGCNVAGDGCAGQSGLYCGDGVCNGNESSSKCIADRPTGSITQILDVASLPTDGQKLLITVLAGNEYSPISLITFGFGNEFVSTGCNDTVIVSPNLLTGQSRQLNASISGCGTLSLVINYTSILSVN